MRHSLSTQRTNPAVPGATFPTLPMPGALANEMAEHAMVGRRAWRSAQTWRAVGMLLGLAVALEALYLALLPLFARSMAATDPAQQIVLSLFPWLPRLYWTNIFPFLEHLLENVPLFQGLSVERGSGNAALLLALLCLGYGLVLGAAYAGLRAVRDQRVSARLLCWLVMLLALLFGLTFLIAPSVSTRDVFLYDFYGRAAFLYHANPYAIPAALVAHDPLYALIRSGVSDTLPFGPLWLDVSIPLVLVARADLAHVLLGFRILGLLLHLANAGLIWLLLTRLRPSWRLAGTVLYSWNPLVLLLSIGEMHLISLVVCLVLLAGLFFQRKALLLSWVMLLLAVLVNVLCLIFLPVFACLLWRETRGMRRWARALWWLGLIGVTGLVFALAYGPYWQGWGLPGVLGSLRQTFWPEQALNSLNAALLRLPLMLPTPLAWLAQPQHWIMLALVAASIVLLVGMWLVDGLPLSMFFQAWLYLLALLLMPIYWPWYLLLALALALCSANGTTLSLTLALVPGGLLAYYFLHWQPAWPGQALLTIGLPLLLWGWYLFFASTWRMTRRSQDPSRPLPRVKARGVSISRGSWPSRPPGNSRPSLPARWRAW